jgi:histone H3/H4
MPPNKTRKSMPSAESKEIEKEKKVADAKCGDAKEVLDEKKAMKVVEDEVEEGEEVESGEEEEEEEDEEEEEEEENEDDEAERPLKRSRIVKRRPVFSDKLPAIPKAAFKRLVREVTYDQQLNKNEKMKWTPKAMEALHVGAEAFVIDKFYNAFKKSVMCKKKTVGVGHFD